MKTLSNDLGRSVISLARQFGVTHLNKIQQHDKPAAGVAHTPTRRQIRASLHFPVNSSVMLPSLLLPVKKWLLSVGKNTLQV